MGVICEYEIELLDIFCQAMEKRDICIQRMDYTELFWSYIKVQKSFQGTSQYTSNDFPTQTSKNTPNDFPNVISCCLAAIACSKQPNQAINSLGQRQNECHVADSIFKFILWYYYIELLFLYFDTEFVEICPQLSNHILISILSVTLNYIYIYRCIYIHIYIYSVVQ